MMVQPLLRSQGLAAAGDSLVCVWSAGVVARVRSKLVAEQRRVAGQQATEREALLQQLQETRGQLRLEQLRRKEVGGGGGGVLCVRVVEGCWV